MWDPTQLALIREAGIAGNSISAGLTALRKANYAANGIYSSAFFSLSIGLERTLKLIYIMDFLLEKDSYPSDTDLRSMGHDIEKLFVHCRTIQANRSVNRGPKSLDDSSIEYVIVKFMSRFAKSTRYYNLNFISGGSRHITSCDPISDWYESVGKPVLKLHMSKKQEEKIKINALMIESLYGSISTTAFTAEDGTPLSDAYSASYQTGITEIIRKYGTFYCASLCRYLYYVLYGMTRLCQSKGHPVPYLEELFFPFMNGDKYLLGLKTFPPRSQ